jgi:DNA-binding HxlR family transcriptional regulator
MERAESELCPKVEAAFGLLAKKWTALILFSLNRGEMRFSEFEEAIPGISARLLSLRMRELEEEGLVNRRVRTGAAPISVTYSLTKKGASLSAILLDIAKWAKNYL